MSRFGRPIAGPDEAGPLGEAVDWRLRLADRELSPAEEAEFQAWRQDPENATAFDEIAEIWRRAGDAASLPAILGMRRAALDDLHRARAFRWRRSPALRWAAMAACLVLMAGAGLAWLQAQPRLYATAIGERRVVSLADGSKVSMDGATRVRVAYVAGRREFWLDGGRAKFDVAKDPLRPFTVTAGGEMVVATGTEFSVELLRNQVRVALYEGHVTVWRATQKPGALQPVTAGGQAAEQLLTPGRELVTETGAAEGQVLDADPQRSLAWESGQLVFENEPLASALERVNRYAAQPVRMTQGAGRDVRISGVFVAGDTDAFIQGVVSLFPLKAVRANDGLILEVDPRRGAGRPLGAAPLG